MNEPPDPYPYAAYGFTATMTTSSYTPSTGLLEALEAVGLLDLTRWPRPRPGWRDQAPQG